MLGESLSRASLGYGRKHVLTSLGCILVLQLGAMQHWWCNGLQKIAKPGGSFPDLKLLPVLPSLLEQQGNFHLKPLNLRGS